MSLYPPDEPQWWMDHNNLALTARFMLEQGGDVAEIIYMLEKPWKHNDDFNLADAQSVIEGRDG